MKCPYCQNEMEEGFIPVNRMECLWVPTKWLKKMWLLPPSDSIFLEKTDLFKNQRVKAYLCRSCQKITVDISKLGEEDKEKGQETEEEERFF